MIASISPSHRPIWLLFAAIVALLPMSLGAPVVAQSATETSIGKIQITVDPDVSVDAASIAETYGAAITDAWPQFVALFAAEPAATVQLAFTTDVAPDTLAGYRWLDDIAWVAPDGHSAIIDAPAFLALTPVEGGNLLRNIVSRAFIADAGGAQTPPGIVDGLARYVEIPIVARQARLGSLVQGLDQAGTLPTLSHIAAGTPDTLTAEVRTANGYALVAFLADRYGAIGLQNMVQQFAQQPDFAAAMSASFGQTPEDLTPAWETFLPRWFASGWRENAVSAFDLTRAETLLQRGAYEAASSEAERSQRLFTDLNDQAGLARVEALLAQSAVGLQADQLMQNTETALASFDYEGALLLLNQADGLYAALPPEHRPEIMIERYRTLATEGVHANAWLQRADETSDSWLQLAGSRGDAVNAGASFANLGDEQSRAEAQAIVDRLDLRLWRLGFILSAVVLATAGWLLAWTWLRRPARLLWGQRIPGAPRLVKARY